MPPLDAEVFDIGGTRFGDPQPVQAEQHRQSRVVMVVALRGEQERSEFAAVQPPALGRVNVGAANVLGRVRRDPPVDVGETVEAAHSGPAPVNRRRRQTLFFEPTAIQLDMRPGRFEHRHAHLGGPGKEPAQIVAVGVKGPAAVAGQERRRSNLSFAGSRSGSRTSPSAAWNR